MASRVNNRLSMSRLSGNCDNFISRENLGRIVEIEYAPCQKIFRYGILRDITLPYFILNVKTWIKNHLDLDITIEQITLSGLFNGTLLKLEEHFQSMNELRNVYSFKILPIIGIIVGNSDDFYSRYIPRRSLLDIESNHRSLFIPPSGFYIYYFECVFKMNNHKKKYNVMETWTLDEFIRNILEWFIQDCQLDRSKQYEIITLDRRILPLYNSTQRIKNILITHPNLFPAFYIRERDEVIINIPISRNIINMITPIITPIIRPITPTMTECSICLEMVRDIPSNHHFDGCRHVLCSGCNYECIRTRNLTCPECRRPRR